MSLGIKLNGAEYTNFISARVSRSIDVLTSAFSFTSSANANSLFPIRAGDRVEITADGLTVCNGFVDELAVNYASNEHLITVSGRGILADLIDSTVGATKEFVGGVSLSSIARTVLDDIGLNSVRILNSAGTVANFTADEMTSAEVGQGAFEFLESFARKRQVFLNETSDGDLSLSRGTTVTAPIELQSTKATATNNIKSANVRIDHKNRYNTYTVQSQLNPLFQDEAITPAETTDQSGSATDSLIRSTRQLELNAEESQDSTGSGKRATWEANIRRARSFTYTATIYGHTHGGSIIEPNTRIKVVDNFCNIDAQLLIRSVDLVFDLDNGSITTLQCAPKDAYTLEAEQSQREASTSSTGEDFEWLN